MTIGIDASRSHDAIQKTGVEAVSDGLIKALSHTDAEFVYYTPQKIVWLPKSHQHVFGPKRLWTFVGLSLEMLRNKPDVLFVPVHTLPFFVPKKTYRIIHDIAFIKNPKLYSWFERVLMKWDVWRSVRLCEKIFVSTQLVKDDLLKYAHARDDQVVVTGFGYERRGAHLRPMDSGGQGKKQLLFIGRIEEKKNVANLIRAFKLFHENNPEFELLLAGKPSYGFDDIKSLVTHSKLPVTFLGFISDEEKYKLLSESAALVHVPKEEGFSFPLLEAFDFKLPVIASDIPALREVGGDACEFVDPLSPADIAESIERVVADQKYADMLTTNGAGRLSEYSWDNVATKILKIMSR